MNDITKETGIYTTSCGHSFHLRCAVGWLCQNNEKDTCPMCRHEFGDLERLPESDDVDAEDEEEDEDEDEDEEELEEEIPAFDDGAHALWVMRKTFEMLDDGLSITSDEPPLPPQIPLLPPKEDIFQIFRGHDSVEYVRNSRIHHHGHSGLMDVDRGYESA